MSSRCSGAGRPARGIVVAGKPLARRTVMTMTTCLSTAAPSEAEPISLYDAIGGRASLIAAVDVFYRRVLDDPELSPFFPGGVGERHRAYLVTFLGEALGGPSRYRGREIATAHRELGINEAQFDCVAGHLDATLG